MFHVEHSGLFACGGEKCVGAKWCGREESGEPGRFSAGEWKRVFRNGATWGRGIKRAKSGVMRMYVAGKGVQGAGEMWHKRERGQSVRDAAPPGT